MALWGSQRGVCLDLRKSLPNGQIQLPSLNGCSSHLRFTDSCSPKPHSPHTISLSHFSLSQRSAPDNYKLKCVGEFVLESGVSIKFLFKSYVPTWNIYLSQVDKQSKPGLVFISSKFTLTQECWHYQPGLKFDHMLLPKGWPAG